MRTVDLWQGAAFVRQVVSELFDSDAYQATKYLSPKLVVNATRAVNMKTRKPYGARATREGVILTIGAPNYLQRNFIKLCKKAGEPFPILEIQLRDIPKKRA